MQKFLSLLGVTVVALWPAISAGAQTAPWAQASMGHVHLAVQDVDANKKFWAAMGGTPMSLGGVIDGVQFGTVRILLRKVDAAPAPAVGSVINHFGFSVPNVQEALAKWKAAGLKTEAGRNAQQGFVYTPGDLVKVEILEDAKQTVPVVFHHVHFFVADAGPGAGGLPEMQAWYAKMFGAVPGKRGNFDTANVPGGELTFTKSDMPVVTSKGHGVDHIGFQVNGLEAYCKKLEASGMKLDTPYTKRPDLGLALAFITDPWGTSIELNENLPAAK